MPTLAIIGTGISGLGCAHFLHRHFDVTLFEQHPQPGGHANTVTVAEAGTGRAVPIDTGFMVFNYETYPELTRLFGQLDVPVKPTDMSFSVRHEDTGLEFCGSSLNHLFAQRRNLLRRLEAGQNDQSVLLVARFLFRSQHGAWRGWGVKV